MKKIFLALLGAVPLLAAAQNIQLHFDFGIQEDGVKRNFLVSTFEHFQPDSLGYTFLFTDFEFDSPDKPMGASLGYFEIARSFYMPWFRENKALKNLMVHIEYNDGAVIYPDFEDDSRILGENLRSSWLGGLEYELVLGDLSLNTMLLYKYIRGSSAPDAQFTMVWFYPLFNYRLNLSGYIDVWSQDDFSNNPDDKIIAVYSEPQLWYTMGEHFSVGTEIKISKNFVPGSKRVEVFPTLGVKWEF